MLEAMAKALKYKNVNWELIQNPYVPNGLIDQINAENTYKRGQLEVIKLVSTMAAAQTAMNAKNPKVASSEEHIEEIKEEKKTGEQ